jgi:hypothetical protein
VVTPECPDPVEAYRLKVAADLALTRAGLAAVVTARIELAAVVRDPSPRIDRYIRGPSGLGWPTADATFKTVVPYTRNGQFEWCGAFVAHCWGIAGLRAEARREYLASCYRLHQWTGRAIPLANLRPGDILVLASARSPRWGSHIALVDRVDGGIAHTIEGNAHGLLGDGTRGEGVVACERPLVATPGAAFTARFAYRPLAEDLADCPAHAFNLFSAR